MKFVFNFYIRWCFLNVELQLKREYEEHTVANFQLLIEMLPHQEPWEHSLIKERIYCPAQPAVWRPSLEQNGLEHWLSSLSGLQVRNIHFKGTHDDPMESRKLRKDELTSISQASPSVCMSEVRFTGGTWHVLREVRKCHKAVGLIFLCFGAEAFAVFVCPIRWLQEWHYLILISLALTKLTST